MFEKPHCDVLKAIRALDCNEDFSLGNFSLSTYISDRGKEYPEYLMTRLGFSVLTMGFTGAKALKWKIKYAEAFEEIEEHRRVMQDIRELGCDSNFDAHNFVLISYIDSMNREKPEYLMPMY